MTKRFFQACIGTALLILVAVACNNASQAPVDQDSRVLGFYEFEFVNTEEGWVSSVRETPLETFGLSPQDLERIDSTTNPALTITSVGDTFRAASGSTALTPGGGSVYIAGRYEVTNNTATSLDNITFLAYHSDSGFGDGNGGLVFMREGTAVSVAKAQNDSDVSPLLVTPSHRYRYRAGSSHGPTSDSDRYEAISRLSDLVLYDDGDSNFIGIKDRLRMDFGFVKTVFPYGFVVRDSANSERRTVDANGTGVVTFGFRGALPLTTGLEIIRFHAVAVTDDATNIGDTRITQGIEENYRLNTISDAPTQPDGWQAVIDRYVATSIDGTNNRKRISFAGTMQSGERLGLGIPCDDFAPIEDVRIAGDDDASNLYFSTAFPDITFPVHMIAYSRSNSGPITDVKILNPADDPANCDDTGTVTDVNTSFSVYDLDTTTGAMTPLTEGMGYTLEVEVTGNTGDFSGDLKLYVTTNADTGFLVEDDMNNFTKTEAVITLTDPMNVGTWSGTLNFAPYSNDGSNSVNMIFEVSSGIRSATSGAFPLDPTP